MKHTQHQHYALTGAVVHVERFPYREDPRRSKNRYAVVVEQRGNTIAVQGIYTSWAPGRTPVPANARTGLHHDSFIDPRTVTVPASDVGTPIGETQPATRPAPRP